MSNENETSQEVSQKSLLVLNVGGIVIVFATMGLAWFLVYALSIDLWRMSLFISCRTLLLIVFSVLMLPLATFGEYWLSRLRRRDFLWKNILVIIGVLGVFVLVAFFFLTAFDALFHGLHWLWQMPLVAVSNSIGLVAMALTIRNERFKKWRKELGW